MSPTQFVTQCVTNWKCEVKGAHIFQVGDSKTLAEFRRQPFRQVVQNFLAVFRTGFSVLLIFHDKTTDLPICLYHREIDRFISRLTHRLQYLTDCPIQVLAGLFNYLSITPRAEHLMIGTKLPLQYTLSFLICKDRKQLHPFLTQTQSSPARTGTGLTKYIAFLEKEWGPGGRGKLRFTRNEVFPFPRNR